MEPWFLWLLGNSLELVIALGVGILGVGLFVFLRRRKKK